MSYRNIPPNSAHHIYNRSVLKMPLFREATDYHSFLKYMKKYQKKFPVEFHAYCLMPNHFHFLLKEPMVPLKSKITNISLFMQQLQNAYAKYFSYKYGHSGRVFQGVFKNKIIKDDNHFSQIIAYIHQNPVKKLVNDAAHWPYSSAFKGTSSSLQAHG